MVILPPLLAAEHAEVALALVAVSAIGHQHSALQHAEASAQPFDLGQRCVSGKGGKIGTLLGSGVALTGLVALPLGAG